jgi:hypothetical protein
MDCVDMAGKNGMPKKPINNNISLVIASPSSHYENGFGIDASTGSPASGVHLAT